MRICLISFLEFLIVFPSCSYAYFIVTHWGFFQLEQKSVFFFLLKPKLKMPRNMYRPTTWIEPAVQMDEVFPIHALRRNLGYNNQPYHQQQQQQ